MDVLLKIDDVAKQSGLSKRTIRYYEEIGVLPSPERSEGGTRLYRQEHVEYLKKIMIVKEVLGFTLQELQHFLSLKETLESQRAEYKKVSDPKEQKEKLNEILAIIDDQLEIIKQKTRKILSVQTELATLRERANAAIGRIDEEISKT
ncbi:DNA-binding transcriptional MerR regulator [Scopulibacillus darangshiensis]|uniref:DNA-binding transcriptional MerR regulator n=1 Tax=Scopulibacillus darangshiensis TaxID=442528 RepID=A0A4R2NB41_9BACL|nr:MerR family transcriptional regulator [Scopulibacillus darangshiensis]TCP18205.1 DNA-binding transcriptional MerR regulator [Scopulibacillus darangshiensis]